MSSAFKKVYMWVSEENSKAKPLGHFKIYAIFYLMKKDQMMNYKNS